MMIGTAHLTHLYEKSTKPCQFTNTNAPNTVKTHSKTNINCRFSPKRHRLVWDWF